MFDDADVECAVNGAAFAAYIASGQTCIAGTRILVQSDIYDRFLAWFLEKVESIRQRMGNRMLIISLCRPTVKVSCNDSDEPAVIDGFYDITTATGEGR